MLLIQNYLVNRYQCTSVNNVKSNAGLINVGVPQGSSLGPLLFLLYINDLPLSTDLKVRLFADDACVSFVHNNPETLNNIINTELEKVNCWLKRNKLFINHSKSNYIIFHKARIKHKFCIKLDGQELSQTNSTKYLGVHIDNKLNWKSHVSYLKAKLARNCYAITKLKNYVGEETLKLVYYSLIYPYLQYCITSWGTASKCNLDPLVKIQKRIVRNLCRMPARTHTNSLFTKLQLLKLSEIHKLQVGKLMHKYKSNLSNVGEFMSTKLTNKHNYNTRISANNNYFIPQTRTNLGLKSFTYIGPKLWQTVPTEIKNKPFIQFKSQYKKLLLQSYSIQ